MLRIYAAICLFTVARPTHAFENQHFFDAVNAVHTAGFATSFDNSTLAYVGTDGAIRIHQFGKNIGVSSDQTGSLEEHKAICSILLAQLGGIDASFAAPTVERAFEAYFAGSRDVAKAGTARITISAPNDRFVECLMRPE